MENKIGVLAVIVEDFDKVERVNELLHEARDYIVGRLGVPYRKRGVSVISVVIDAPSEAVNALSGKLGMLKGVTCKVLLTK